MGSVHLVARRSSFLLPYIVDLTDVEKAIVDLLFV